MTISIASLGLRIDSSGVAAGVDKLDDLVVAAEAAEAAEDSLAQTSKEASAAVAEVGKAAAEAAQGVSAMEATTVALAEAEETAKSRIREMVRASLEKQQAMLATAAATRQASQATRDLNQSQSAGRSDSLGNSFAQAQQELEALSDAMANQAQSLDDVGERRAWLTDLYERGLISFRDTEQHLKTLDKQERELEVSIAAHAREAQNLLRTYDPASAAIQRLAEDERKLEDALKSGTITRTQYNKAIAGLQVSRAEWHAQAEGIQEAAQNLNVLAFSSAQAFRDYGQFLSAVARGDLRTASNQILQLGIRTNALRAVLNPTALSIGAAATAAGVLAKAYHDAQVEAFELNKAIVLSGNASGVTAGRLQLMAESIDSVVGTRGAAAETLAQLASTGRVAAENLEEFAVVAQLLKRNAGQPIEDTVKIFAELGREPVEAAIRLNQQMNFLTEAQLEHIQALRQRGEIEAAGNFAQSAFYEQALSRARQLGAELPTLTAGAKAAGDAFRTMWDFASGLFQRETPESRLRDLTNARGNRPLFGGRAQFDINLFAADQQEQELARQIAERDRRIAESAGKARELRDRQEAQAQLRLRLQQEKAIGDAVSGARAAAIQRELDNSASQYAAYEAQLEAEREAGLVSEEVYYAEKRKLIEQNRDAQIEALQLESKRLENQNARVRAAAREESAKADPAERARLEANAQVQVIANQSKIADNEAQIAILRGQAISQLNVLTIQQDASGKAITRSYEDAKAAAEAYLDVLKQQQERELQAFGQGGRAGQRNDTRNRIDDRFADQRLQLESDRRTGPQTEDARRRYEQDLALLEDTHRRAIESDERYWQRRTELEGSFYAGAREAVANYLDEARNVAAQSENLFTNAFQSMEDALIGFAQTGKLDFKSLADSIIADLLRIQIRAAALQALSSSGDALFNLLNLFGSGAVGGTGAGGGTAPANTGIGFAAAGEKYVPRDNAPYLLHKGEAVLPAAMNPFAGGRFPGAGRQVVIQQMLNPAPGMEVGQVRAVVAQANNELMTELFDRINRGYLDAIL